MKAREKALVADLTPEALHATAFGWHAAVQGLGALAAGIVFGLLWQTFGAPVAFMTGASPCDARGGTLGSRRPAEFNDFAE